MACSEDSVAYVRPSTYLIVALVNPIKRSQNPPYQGAHFGMNFQATPLLFKVSVSNGKLNSFIILQQQPCKLMRVRNHNLWWRFTATEPSECLQEGFYC